MEDRSTEEMALACVFCYSLCLVGFEEEFSRTLFGLLPLVTNRYMGSWLESFYIFGCYVHDSIAAICTLNSK